MTSYLTIRPDATFARHPHTGPVTLELLYQHLGSPVERCTLLDDAKLGGIDLWFCESGKDTQEPVNSVATMLAHACHAIYRDDWVAGDALICGFDGKTGDSMPLGDAHLRWLLDRYLALNAAPPADLPSYLQEAAEAVLDGRPVILAGGPGDYERGPRPMPVLYQEDLAMQTCDNPDCGHAPGSHEMLYMHAGCHPEAATNTVYDFATGQLVVVCAECQIVIARVVPARLGDVIAPVQ